MKSLDKYVIFSIGCMLVYTVLSVLVTVFTGYTMDTLTTCFFGFFGGEIVTCAVIKIFKLRGEYIKIPETTTEDETEVMG